MTRGSFNRLIVPLGWCAGLQGVALSAEQPNVLIIAVDDLNDYPLSGFNNVKTPNFDAFATNALNFSRTYCAAPICNPSRAALISGIAPYRSGIYDNADAWERSALVDNCVPMPMSFKQNGYTTLWSGKFWHGSTRPYKKKLDLWWDEYVGIFSLDPYPENPGLSTEISPLAVINYENYVEGMEGLPDSAWWDTRTTDETIERLGRDFDKPFFMVCGLIRPHVPFTAPRRFFEMYDLNSIQLPNWRADDWDDIPAGVKNIIPEFIDFQKLLESGKWKEVVRAYLACISFTDYNFGRVMDALANSRYADNTIVVVWSDHGYHVGEKSRLEKHALWERTTHNIFMIKTPDGKGAGETCDRTVSLLDIYPTLVELCNLTNIPEGQLDGCSLMPLLEDPAAEWNHPAIMTYLYGNHAVRDERYRYIFYPGIGEELYDLENDPDEFVNLAGNPEYDGVKQSLAAYLPTENAPPAGKREVVPVEPTLSSSLLFSLISRAPDPVIRFDGATHDAVTATKNIFTYTSGTIHPGESGVYSRAYSTSTPLIDSDVSGYTGQPVYGGAYVELTNGTAAVYTNGVWAILQYAKGTAESVKMQSYVANTQIGRTANMALLFAASGAGNYGFDASSSLSATMSLSGSGGAVTNRWLVVAGGTSYVSPATFDVPFTSAAITLDNPDAINWAVWTPGTNMSFGSLTNNIPGSSITNITHSGVAVNASLPAGTGNRMYLMEAFSAVLSGL